MLRTLAIENRARSEGVIKLARALSNEVNAIGLFEPQISFNLLTNTVRKEWGNREGRWGEGGGRVGEKQNSEVAFDRKNHQTKNKTKNDYSKTENTPPAH